MRFQFFYDESEHSREIGFNTITASNYYDNFITAIVGWQKDKASRIENAYLAFEKKYEQRKSNGELKSSTIKGNQLKYGFASLNRDNVSFLSDFFSLFTEDVYVYISVISKIEYIIHQLFIDYKNTLFVDTDALKYSLIKALIVYKPIEVERAIYESPRSFVEETTRFLENRIAINQDDPILKERENEAFKNILLILKDVKMPQTFSWDYRPPFWGFQKFLTEKAISDYSLLIDREGEHLKTVSAALNEGLINVSDEDSSNSAGIRMADMLAGLLGKMMKALSTSLHPTELNTVKKIVLSEDWFKINEAQFQLYKQLNRILRVLNNAWYKTYSSIYSDDLISLFSLADYFSQFPSVESIKKDVTMHGEYYNSCVLQHLMEHYSIIQNKLPIEPIPKESMKDDYYIDQRGAKVFYNGNQQPMLPLIDGPNTFFVLSTGFNDLTNTPVITIEENGNPLCYRLPDELYGWAYTAVLMANMGVNLFPCEVVFNKKDGRYTFEFL